MTNIHKPCAPTPPGKRHWHASFIHTCHKGMELCCSENLWPAIFCNCSSTPVSRTLGSSSVRIGNAQCHESPVLERSLESYESWMNNQSLFRPLFISLGLSTTEVNFNELHVWLGPRLWIKPWLALTITKYKVVFFWGLFTCDANGKLKWKQNETTLCILHLERVWTRYIFMPSHEKLTNLWGALRELKGVCKLAKFHIDWKNTWHLSHSCPPFQQVTQRGCHALASSSLAQGLQAAELVFPDHQWSPSSFHSSKKAYG